MMCFSAISLYMLGNRNVYNQYINVEDYDRIFIFVLDHFYDLYYIILPYHSDGMIGRYLLFYF